MSTKLMTLWQVIFALEQQMPLSKAKVETLLRVALSEVERSEYFVHFAGKGPMLSDGLSITNLDLMLRPSMEFDQKSAFAMELDGACISLNDVRNRFGDLELAQYPRGRSLQETTVWSVQREWGTLSFAFKEDRPTCLFRVSFRK